MSIQEEKQLVLQDLCARIPYSQIVDIDGELKRLIAISNDFIHFTDLTDDDLDGIFDLDSCVIKPCLRPLSSMTEEERAEFREIGGLMSYNPQNDTWALAAFTPEAYDWLNSHYFDYRGLIEMDLANPLEEMNKKSNQ